MSGSGSPKASSSSSKRRRSEDASSKKRKRTKRSPAEPEESAPPEPAGARGTEIGDDFVAFGASSDGEDEAGAAAEPAPAPREWDEGKPAAREGGRAGRRERERERERRRDDDEDGFANKKQRLDAASRRAPWVDVVDWEACTNVAEMLHMEVSAFVEYISPTPVEHEIRGLIIESISKVVRRAYPDAQVLPFGSFETKLYLPLGDIDLVIQSDSMAYSDKVNVLHSLANTLRRAGITDKVTIIAKAKVPIVKFVTTHGRFAVDISINQINGVAAITLVNTLMRTLPALRALVLVVKAFLSQRAMNEVFTGGLGSYSVVCLAASFLQQHPKARRGELDPSRNLGVLVVEFFEFYGLHFNYQEVGISLRDGGTYYSKSRRGWADYKNSGLLSIEDPTDPSNDISRGSYGIMRVRQTLAGAYEIMLASAYQRAETIRARRSGRYHSLRNDYTSREEWSIMASVMGVTQETINHRRVVQEVYDKRVLHKMLGVEPVAISGADPTADPDTPGSASKAYPVTAGVAAVWEAADDSESAASEEAPPPPPPPPSRKRKPARQQPAKDADEESAEESRYAIVKDGAGPPAKRRRTGQSADAHTVFTTDEEEGEYAVDDGDDSDEEEGEVAEKGARPDGRSSAERRSYWLSKGVGPPNDSD